MKDACNICGRNIGRLERFQIRVTRRVFRNVEKRFKLDLHSFEYEGACKFCMIAKAENRINVLNAELQIEAAKSGKTVADYVKEVKLYVEKEVGKFAKAKVRF